MYSTTSAYSLTSLPAKPRCHLSNRPTRKNRQKHRSYFRCANSLLFQPALYPCRPRKQVDLSPPLCRIIRYMLDLRQLQHNIRALTNGDDACRREAIRELRKHPEEEWATVASEATQPLIDWLKDQLAGESQHGVGRQEVVTILANLGPRAEPAVPELIELLKAGTVERIRETAAIALGKIGKN